jgi:hypothetical protein
VAENEGRPAEEQKEPRGVFNPNVVDLISYDAERAEVVLLMLEERAWDTDPEQLRQLEAKFNSYLSYVLDGHLSQQYPDYADKDVCFRLDCADSPRGEAEKMLRAMQNFAAGENIRFVVQRIESPAVPSAGPA